MSWIIKASPVIPALEQAFPDEPRPFEAGDKVRVLPWEGTDYGLEYDVVIRDGGPEGVIDKILDPQERWERGRPGVRIQFRDHDWLLPLEYVELI